MNAGIDMCGTGVEAGTHDPAELAMRVHAGADKLGLCAHDKIAAQPLPDEMKVVMIAPDIGTGAADRIVLPLHVVDARAGQLDGTNINLVFKYTERIARRRHSTSSSNHRSASTFVVGFDGALLVTAQEPDDLVVAPP